MKPITVVVHGAMGKMGKTVINAVYQEPETRLVGAVDIKVTGERLQLPDGSGDVPLSTDLDSILVSQKPDVLVDFSVAKAAMPAIRLAAKRKVNLVIGTTGFSAADVEEIIVKPDALHTQHPPPQIQDRLINRIRRGLGGGAVRTEYRGRQSGAVHLSVG